MDEKHSGGVATYHELAHALRTLAPTLSNEAAEELRTLASGYDRLAEYAEAQTRGDPDPLC